MTPAIASFMGAEGLEPSRLLQSTDFKSAASTIPPRPQGFAHFARANLTDVYSTTKRAYMQLFCLESFARKVPPEGEGRNRIMAVYYI